MKQIPISRHELTWAEGRRLVRAGRTVGPHEALENDLALAKALYLTRREHQSGKRRHQDRERAASIIKTAMRLAELLSCDGSGRRAVPLPLHLEDPEKYLRQIIAAAREALKPKPASQLDRQMGECFMSWLGIGRGMSSFDWLAGQHLPQIFVRHFESPARAHPASDYVCWAEEELVKLGVTFNKKPYERAAIVRAMSVARKGGRKMGKSE
jgi:hypothetical protein